MQRIYRPTSLSTMAQDNDQRKSYGSRIDVNRGYGFYFVARLFFASADDEEVGLGALDTIFVIHCRVGKALERGSEDWGSVRHAFIPLNRT